MSLAQTLRRSLPILTLAGLTLSVSSCRRRGVRTETLENLPPLEITDFTIDVREPDCAHTVVAAAKDLKTAIEQEMSRVGFTVVQSGQGEMTARGTTVINRCRGASAVATVDFNVLSPEGQRLARVRDRYRLKTQNQRAADATVGKAAKVLVVLVRRSGHLRNYAAKSRPNRKTAVASADRATKRKVEPEPEERKVEPEPEERKVEPEPKPDPKPLSAADAPPLNPDWIVAVMDVKDLNAGDEDRAIGEDVIRNLGSQLRIFIAQRGAKTIDKSAQDQQIRMQVKEMKNDTYKSCYDDSCQIELGKALAASHILRSQITRFGSRCVLNAELFDLRSEVTIAASSSRGDCEPEGFLRMSQEVANSLNAQ